MDSRSLGRWWLHFHTVSNQTEPPRLHSCHILSKSNNFHLAGSKNPPDSPRGGGATKNPPDSPQLVGVGNTSSQEQICPTTKKKPPKSSQIKDSRLPGNQKSIFPTPPGSPPPSWLECLQATFSLQLFLEICSLLKYWSAAKICSLFSKNM